MGMGRCGLLRSLLWQSRVHNTAYYPDQSGNTIELNQRDLQEFSLLLCACTVDD